MLEVNILRHAMHVRLKYDDNCKMDQLVVLGILCTLIGVPLQCHVIITCRLPEAIHYNGKICTVHATIKFPLRHRSTVRP